MVISLWMQVGMDLGREDQLPGKEGFFSHGTFQPHHSQTSLHPILPLQSHMLNQHIRTRTVYVEFTPNGGQRSLIRVKSLWVVSPGSHADWLMLEGRSQ